MPASWRVFLCVVETNGDRQLLEQDGLNAPATACSTDVLEIESDLAQPHQGVGVVHRKGPSPSTRWRLARAKRTFLADYRQWGNITSACEQAHVSRGTYYNWLEQDEAFALAARVAGQAATERLEREAHRRAIEGSPYSRTSYYRGEPVGTDHKIEYSDSLMALLLRARKPEVYREKLDLNVTTVVKTIAGVDPLAVL